MYGVFSEAHELDEVELIEAEILQDEDECKSFILCHMTIY